MTMAWILLGVAGVLIVGNAVFVAAETALVTVDRNLVESRAREGSVRFGRVRGALQRLSTYLSGAQLGITVTSLAIGLVAEPSLATLLRGPLDALGLDADVTEVAALALTLLLATAVQMVFGELVPKNIALSRPADSVVWVVIPLLVFTKVTRPLIAVLNGSANQLLRLVGVEPVEELRSARTPDELASVVRRAGVQGALGSETAGLMERSLAFGAKTAADVMTPRTRVRTVWASAPVATVIEATRDTGHSRFPVIGDSVDDIRGVIHVKQAVAVAQADRTTTRIREVMTVPVLVPPSMALDPLLDRLQEMGLQLAVVVDEYGGTAGIVTFEDLVEELVGDVVDEHDSPAPGIWRQPDGSWLLSGLLRPDEIQAAIGLELPAGRASYETVAGLMLQLLRRIPDVGDQVDVPGATLTVDRLDGRRIERVEVRLHLDNTDSTAADDSADQPNRRRRGRPVTVALLMLAVGLIAANGFFVGAEFAVLASRRSRLEPLLRSSRRARTALRAIEQLPLMISACQFGITLASLGLGALAEPVVASLLTDPLAALRVPHELIHPLALAIALTLVSCLHMLLGEMVPKNLALTGPERAAMVLAPPLLLFVQIFRPIIIGLTAVATLC